MRRLILHRQRALVGFALNYYCILNQSRDAFLEELSHAGPDHLPGRDSEYVLTNGGTVTVDIGEEPVRFFVAVYPEKRHIVTHEITVEAGTADAEYIVLTDCDARYGMGVAVVPLEELRAAGAE